MEMEVIKRAAVRRKMRVRMNPFNLGEADMDDRVRSPEGCRLQIAYLQYYVVDIPEDGLSLGIDLPDNAQTRTMVPIS